jgi:hypothetical protein
MKYYHDPVTKTLFKLPEPDVYETTHKRSPYEWIVQSTAEEYFKYSKSSGKPKFTTHLLRRVELKSQTTREDAVGWFYSFNVPRACFQNQKNHERRRRFGVRSCNRC